MHLSSSDIFVYDSANFSAFICTFIGTFSAFSAFILPWKPMGWFVHVAAFNAGGYFRTDRQALVYGSFSVSLSSQYFRTKVCPQMTSCGDLCHLGTSKLDCETNL